MSLLCGRHYSLMTFRFFQRHRPRHRPAHSAFMDRVDRTLQLRWAKEKMDESLQSTVTWQLWYLSCFIPSLNIYLRIYQAVHLARKAADTESLLYIWLHLWLACTKGDGARYRLTRWYTTCFQIVILWLKSELTKIKRLNIQ